MGEQSPFVTSPADQFSQVRHFFRAHVRLLGRRRGMAGFAETLARFASLRLRIGRSPAPMVDDAVAFAVAMYRTLCRSFEPDKALASVEAAIVATGTEIMKDWIPTDRSMGALGAQVRTIMSDAESRGIYAIAGMTTSDTAISWDITSCRYAALTSRLGAPEVGRVFCAVDRPFVDAAIPEIDFSCDTTIARGDDRCRFRVGDAVPVELRARR